MQVLIKGMQPLAKKIDKNYNGVPAYHEQQITLPPPCQEQMQEGEGGPCLK